MKTRPLIAAPKGVIIPANVDCPIIDTGTFVEKLVKNEQEDVAIVVLTNEELIVLVEKPHLFGIDLLSLVGVPGGSYDAVWTTYVAPFPRISVDTLPAEVRKIREFKQRRDANVKDEPALKPVTPETARLRDDIEPEGEVFE